MRQYSKWNSSSWQGPKIRQKSEQQVICGKLPRVNTWQKLWGIRKTSSSLTSANGVC